MSEAPSRCESNRFHFGRFLMQQKAVLVTACCGEFLPDDAAHQSTGLASLLDTPISAISAWSCGLSALLEQMLRQHPATVIDRSRVAVLGHSRLGKAALWTAAHDGRVTHVLSNNSGCCGAALSRRCFGERVAHITRRFPHWFTGSRLAAFADRESELPVDQHQLLACVAPRKIYVTSASRDGALQERKRFVVADCVRQSGLIRWASFCRCKQPQSGATSRFLDCRSSRCRNWPRNCRPSIGRWWRRTLAII